MEENSALRNIVSAKVNFQIFGKYSDADAISGKLAKFDGVATVWKICDIIGKWGS